VNNLTETKNYQTFLKETKEQIKAIGSVNFEMTVLYYKIAKALDKKQQDEGWGAKVIEKLSIDLKNEISKIIYKEYQDIEIV